MLKHELVDLAEPNDLGNTAAHLAVFHDSPGLVILLLILAHLCFKFIIKVEYQPFN